MKTQWHPPFVNLMALALGDHYTVEPEVPVSDLPRRADLVLIHREEGNSPFDGIWMHLRPWNLFEFKGPTDGPEEADLGLLMHVGTGVHGRLTEERKGRIKASDFALWYVTPSLGEAFYGAAQQRAFFETEGLGLWKAKSWGHPVFLLNYGALDLRHPDALPLALLRRDLGDAGPVRDLLATRPDLLERFKRHVVTFQPALWEALKEMSQYKGIIDEREVARVLLQDLSTEEAIQAIGEDKVIRALGEERLLQKLLQKLTPEQLADLVKKQQEQK